MKATFAIIYVIMVNSFITAQTLSLYDAIQFALQNNSTIMYAVNQNYLSGFAQLNTVKAAYNPSMNVQVSLSRNLAKTQYQSLIQGEELYQVNQYQEIYPNFSIGQTYLTPFGSKLTLTGGLQTIVTGISSFNYQTQPTVGILYQQPLSSSGISSGHADLDQAELSFQQTDINYQLQREQLILNVIQSFFQYWQAGRSVEQTMADVESAKRVLEIAEMKLKQGSIAEFEVLNLRVQYNLAEDNLLQSENNYKTQKVSFLRILGANLDSTVQLKQNIEIDSIDFTLNEAYEKAFLNRLELKQAQISLSGTKLNCEQISSSLSPFLQLNANYNLSSNFETTFFRSFTLPKYGWNIIGTISIPVFDGDRTSSQLEISERNIAVQEENIKLMKEEIAIDIETRYRTLTLDMRRFNSLQLNLDVAAEALKIAELRFHSGDISSTEIENVRNRYNTARNTLDASKISYMIERAGLAKAMGELFKWIEGLKDKR